MNITCPACGETTALHQVTRSEYPSIAPQLVGGYAMALVFELSRKRRFRCEKCGGLFCLHTNASRLWLTFWVSFCAFLAFLILSFSWVLLTR
jgi:hypothetical protein